MVRPCSYHETMAGSYLLAGLQHLALQPLAELRGQVSRGLGVRHGAIGTRGFYPMLQHAQIPIKPWRMREVGMVIGKGAEFDQVNSP